MLTVMEPVVLEIAEGAASSDPDVGLRAIAALRALAERLEVLQVQTARELSWSWQDIAERLGVTKQTLRRRPGLRPPGLVRRWRRRHHAQRAMPAAHAPGPRPPEATGRYCAPGPRPSGHIPFTPASKKILELTLREAVALHDSHIGVEHITLALTTIKQGLVPTILSEAGAPAPALRAAILDRYRRAS